MQVKAIGEKYNLVNKLVSAYTKYIFSVLVRNILANSSRFAKFANFFPTKIFPCTILSSGCYWWHSERFCQTFISNTKPVTRHFRIKSKLLTQNTEPTLHHVVIRTNSRGGLICTNANISHDTLQNWHW